MGVSRPQKLSRKKLFDTTFVRSETVEAKESRKAKAKVSKRLLSHFIEESKNQNKVENSKLTLSYNPDEPDVDDESDSDEYLTPKLKERIRKIFSKKEPKAIKVSAHVYYPYQLMAFLDLLETSPIKQFLEADQCKIFADKYLLAIVFTYFVRANFDHETEFTEANFFAALLLAHDIEEENDSVADYMTLIWDNHSIRKNGEKNYIPLRRLRYDLFVRLGFRALVSRRCIEEAISLAPDLEIWKRARKPTHSGARRGKDEDKVMRLVSLDSQSYGDVLPNFPCQACLRSDLLNVHSSLLNRGKQNAIATRGTRLSLKKRLYQHDIAVQIKEEKKLKHESASDE